MEPQQTLFSQLHVIIEGLGYDVYDDALPPDGTPYPFVYLGDSDCADINRKNAVQGIVTQTIHFWHNNPRERGSVSAMILNVKNALRKLSNRTGWSVSSMYSRILADNTTKTPLLHGILEVGMSF